MAKRIKGAGVAEVLDTLRAKDGAQIQMQAEIAKCDRPAWEDAVSFGFVHKEKVQGFVWFMLTDEAHRG